MMTLRVRSFLGLAAVVSIAGCECSAKVGDVRPAHEIAAYRPTTPDAKIDAVSLGTNDRDSIRGATIGTSFPGTADRVIVWYRWEGAEDGRHVQIRWQKDGEQVLEQEERLDTPFGDSAWLLKTPDGSALPAGDYRVELIENGKPVTVIPFTVGP